MDSSIPGGIGLLGSRGGARTGYGAPLPGSPASPGAGEQEAQLGDFVAG